MGMATSKVRLNICGSSYVVNTSESEDYMKNLADRLNLDMNELMASSNSVSITTAAVMTALNYRDELEKASGSAVGTSVSPIYQKNLARISSESPLPMSSST